jgi:hypothetical protein
MPENSRTFRLQMMFPTLLYLGITFSDFDAAQPGTWRFALRTMFHLRPLRTVRPRTGYKRGEVEPEVASYWDITSAH